MSAGIIAPHVGRETMLGAYRLARWDLAIWDEWLSWARTVLPDPMDVAEQSCLRLARKERPIRAALATAKDGADKEALQADLADLMGLQEQIVKEGLTKSSSYLAVNGNEVNTLLSSPRGSARLLWILTRQHQPNVTEDEALDIVNATPADKLKAAFNVVSGKVPPGGNGEARPA